MGSFGTPQPGSVRKLTNVRFTGTVTFMGSRFRGMGYGVEKSSLSATHQNWKRQSYSISSRELVCPHEDSDSHASPRAGVVKQVIGSSQFCKPKWEFPKIRGTCFGGSL